MMLGEQHDRAQELAAQAMLAAQSDDRERALELYAEAADLERTAFLQVPVEKVRTRGILAVSFVSMLYKAREYDRAESELYGLLAQEELKESAKAQLRELLEVVWDEKTIAEKGYQYSDDDRPALIPWHIPLSPPRPWCPWRPVPPEPTLGYAWKVWTSDGTSVPSFGDETDIP